MSRQFGKSRRAAAFAAMFALCAIVTVVVPAHAASPASQEATRILQSQHRNDEDIQGRAAKRLVALGPDAVQPLIVALKGKDPFARALAARALGVLQDTAAMSALVAAMDDADAEVRYRSAEALAEMGDRRASAALRMLEAWGPLSGSYDSLIGLGKLGDTSAIGQLAARARKSGSYESGKAILALLAVGRPLATESLGALLNVGDSGKRFVVIWALSICRDTTARRFLRQAIGDSVARNRGKALADLVAMDTVGAPGILRPLLNSGYADLRASAASLLLPRDIRTLTPDLLLMYNHPDSAVRVAAIDAAARVYRMTHDSSGRASALGMVVRALQDSSALVRRSASSALRFVPDVALGSIRISALSDPDAGVRQHAAEGLQLSVPERIVEPLLPLLNDPYREVKFQAIKAIAYRGDGRATRPLLALLPEASEVIRAAVAWSFTQLKDTAAVPDLELIRK
jgi:HEAT repeat protein